MKIRRALTAGCTAALLAVPFAFAQPAPSGRTPGRWRSEAMGMYQGAAGGPGMAMHHGRRGMEHRRVAMLTDVLQLTEQQQQAWKTIREDTRAKVKPLAEQAFALRKEVREALETGSADATVVGAKVIEAHEARTKIRAAVKAGRDAFAALLTPEQTAKLHTLQQARKFMGPGGFRSQPPAGS